MLSWSIGNIVIAGRYIERKQYSRTPCDVVIGAGRIAAHTQGADDLAISINLKTAIALSFFA